MLEVLRAHTAGGDALYSGGLLLIVAVLLPARDAPGWRTTLSRWLAIAGVVLIVCSAAPLPEWLWAAWLASWFAWRWTWRSAREPAASDDGPDGSDGPDDTVSRYRYRYRVGAMAREASAVVITLVTIGCLWVEFRQIPGAPVIEPGQYRSVIVIGDSISAGLGDVRDGQRWPELLAARHGWQVANLSQAGMGVKLSSRVTRLVDEVRLRRPLVIVELGGNDMLSGQASLADYERNFDALLHRLSERFGSENVYVVELPLLPTGNRWGQTQRRIIQRHDMHRIPKRVFAAVLGANGATDDGLHLSPIGHRLMTAALADWFRPIASNQ